MKQTVFKALKEKVMSSDVHSTVTHLGGPAPN